MKLRKTREEAKETVYFPPKPPKKVIEPKRRLTAQQRRELAMSNLASSKPSHSAEQLNHHLCRKPTYEEIRNSRKTGLYGYVGNSDFLAEFTQLRLREIIDLTEPEIQFYTVWNTFLLKREVLEKALAYDKLSMFVEAHHKEIWSPLLSTVWITFLSYMKMERVINEYEFWELAFHKTTFENKWHGCHKAQG